MTYRCSGTKFGGIKDFLTKKIVCHSTDKLGLRGKWGGTKAFELKKWVQSLLESLILHRDSYF
jgi:hypothetical protein